MRLLRILIFRILIIALILVLIGATFGWYTLPGLAERRHWIPWLIFGLVVLEMLALVLLGRRRAEPQTTSSTTSTTPRPPAT